MKRQIFAGTLVAAAALIGGSVDAATLTSQATVVPATQPVTFSIYLPLRNTAAMQALLAAQQTKGSASYHQWLTPAQVAAQFGPTSDTMSQAQAALTAAGFQITATHLRSIDVTAPASVVNATLRTTLKSLSSANGTTRIISSSRVVVPSALAGAVIPGFAAVPEHHTSGSLLGAADDNRTSPSGGYNYNDLKQAYDYPAVTSLDGTGASVAIVMEASARNEDVAAMFNHENYTATTGKVPPTFTYVPIDGGGVYGGLNDGGTDEAELDVQMVLGGAPGANVAQFSIPNLSDQHIMDAYVAIIDSGAYDIVTSSFGQCELFYAPAYNNGYDFTAALGLYDEIFAFGSMQGITFLASSGDEGGPGCPSTDIVPHFVANLPGSPHFVKGVSTPSGDPFVTSVGGGNLITTFTPPKGSVLNSAYVGEHGFGDPEVPYDEFGIGTKITGGYWGAGGGVSQIFAKPLYQTLVDTGSPTFRTQPDIGMLVGGCPGGISQKPCGPNRSSVAVTIGAPAGSNGVGFRFGFIGTSVSSPELAGALALVVQKHGRQGALNTYLYLQSAAQTAAGGVNAPDASQFYHMNIPGFDGAFVSSASGGYNYIYGNGSPDIRKLFQLTDSPPAGVPQSASNP